MKDCSNTFPTMLEFRITKCKRYWGNLAKKYSHKEIVLPISERYNIDVVKLIKSSI